MGLSDSELSQIGVEAEELASEAKSILFHSPSVQAVFPESKSNASALKFAKRCASFLAEKGKHATLAEIAGYEPKFIEQPARTVGIGDTFSCAYFLAD